MAPAVKKSKLYQKPIAVKKGTIITDHRKCEFVVGKELGSGAFGRIYDGIEACYRCDNFFIRYFRV